MKKLLFFIFIILLSSFSIHKFYVSMYQVNYNVNAKRIEITTRIFIDDINTALEKKYHKKILLGSKQETPEDELALKKYISEKCTIKVNGVIKPMVYLSKELEDNTLICYLKINNIPKISKLEIENTALTEVFENQQNIIQSTIYKEKNSALLTLEKNKAVLK